MGRENLTDDEVYDYGLLLPEKILNESSRSLADFEMTMPQHNWSLQAENPLIAEQLDYDPAVERALAEADVQKMNPEQRDAFDRVIASVEQKLGKVFFSMVLAALGKLLCTMQSPINCGVIQKLSSAFLHQGSLLFCAFNVQDPN
ncbi:hypothetical protein B0H13DRAFT_2315961 [Mycena leptocephala]|nr:hypothetical protein B0H13DRAFT_2315961 [Mycena leptocephala]